MILEEALGPKQCKAARGYFCCLLRNNLSDAGGSAFFLFFDSHRIQSSGIARSPSSGTSSSPVGSERHVNTPVASSIDEYKDTSIAALFSRNLCG